MATSQPAKIPASINPQAPFLTGQISTLVKESGYGIRMSNKPVQTVVVLGGGSAGFIAALTLKRRLPQLQVSVLRSPDIGVIGVGEGTTAVFPRHFFDQLKLKPQQFYREAEPTWKLGIKFLWGPYSHFFYTFAYEYQQRYGDLSRNNGFFYDPQTPYAGPISALMAQDKVFPKKPDGLPQFHNSHAFHIENKKLVAWLEKVSREFGIEIRDVTVRAEAGGEGIAALLTESGERITADLYIDCSGFRSELLGRTLNESYLSYEDTLFCDRAVIGGWARTDEPIKPYTVAETMDHGWCWQIEHENWINRGYVYSSRFVSDDNALQEFLTKNPKVSNEPRVVKFRTGRYRRNWVGNVVGIGNAVGFVEPLEATALQVICVECMTLAESLIDCLCAPNPTLVELYNQYNAQAWDDIRDFLGVHYKFNTRLNTPFWQACRADTQLHGAEFLVQFYRENGPSVVAGAQLLHTSNSFGMDGYLAMLVGQGVPHAKPYSPPAKEAEAWRSRCATWLTDARRAMDVKQCLEAIRRPGMKWA
jgi:tryptophan halogenase